jgi:hypothetical protein
VWGGYRRRRLDTRSKKKGRLRSRKWERKKLSLATMTTTRLILKLSNVITTTTMIFLYQSHERREAAYRVASLGDRIDDITGLYIKVSDYL